MKSKIIVVLLIMNMVISASAQNQNQYGLVYRDAISENVVGKVTIHPVSYEVGGIGVVANVYTPANYDSSKEYVAIVVAHPNGGVKEQVAGLYAQRLAELGYITIAADARYQGASGGEPRNTDRPANRIEDIHGIFLTHAHPDHMGSAYALQKRSGCPIYASYLEKEWFENVDKQFADRPIPRFYHLCFCVVVEFYVGIVFF